METALKQRLVGAMVLVALAVIFLPMLIKGPAPESGVADVSLEAPEPPEAGLETRELPLDAPSADAAAGVLPAMPAPARPAEVAAPTTGMMPPAAGAGNYAVSFGSYATPGDAERVVAALKTSQLPGYHEPVQGNGGRTLHRVRIGPYASQAEAESARLRAAHVRDDVGSKVLVLDAGASQPAAATVAAGDAGTVPQATTPNSRPQPMAPSASVSTPVALSTSRPAEPVALPDATAKAKPATAEPKPAEPKPAPVVQSQPEPPRAAASGVGFAVQLGAFGNAEEAAKLRDRARAAGFSAFVEQVRTDKGTLNRVRIGPVADRGEADRLRTQASAQLGVSGLVRPHP
ncbi:SPOR domain-containing protein [Lysobacter korlensis]|uniref:SPOR domain-containing protein n=1 Tax=Lysobacter korlensis TaxID=553636 RepID=A0ABV6RN35_9GAMM